MLVTTVREMLAEDGIDKITMDGLAERSGLGKGTVFRRFGTRAGIFRALLDEGERDFQNRMMSGPPPLGPGAEPLDRLVALGSERLRFLLANREIARAALDTRTPVPFGPPARAIHLHIRMLLRQVPVEGDDLELMAMQLAAALDTPLLLYMPLDGDGPPESEIEDRLTRGWESLIRRVCR